MVPRTIIAGGLIERDQKERNCSLNFPPPADRLSPMQIPRTVKFYIYIFFFSPSKEFRNSFPMRVCASARFFSDGGFRPEVLDPFGIDQTKWFIFSLRLILQRFLFWFQLHLGQIFNFVQWILRLDLDYALISCGSLKFLTVDLSIHWFLKIYKVGSCQTFLT